MSLQFLKALSRDSTVVWSLFIITERVNRKMRLCRLWRGKIQFEQPLSRYWLLSLVGKIELTLAIHTKYVHARREINDRSVRRPSVPSSLGYASREFGSNWEGKLTHSIQRRL